MNLQKDVVTKYTYFIVPIKKIERVSDFEIVAQDRKLKVVLMELDPLLIKLKQNTWLLKDEQLHNSKSI